jgi:endoglucanase
MYRPLLKILILWFLGFTSAFAAPASLLPDGSFEKISPATGQPDGWPRAAAASWPTEGGSRFLRLQSTGPGKMDTLHVPVSLTSDIRALELSYRYRVSGLQRGAKAWYDARVILNFKDASGQSVGKTPASYHNGNSKGWETRTTRFLVPQNAVMFELMPALFQVKSGTFDLDDIVLSPIDHVALEEQMARNAPPPVPPLEEPVTSKFPPEIVVVGNRLKDKSGREIWLQGVNVASMEWSTKGDNVLRSTIVAIEEWKSNVIRLPVKESYWFGREAGQEDGGKSYRELADAIINLAANRGAYVILDLHRFHFPKPEHVEFWKDAAVRYKNHPAVLFDLFNEPHGISWQVWSDGGLTGKTNAVDEAAFLTAEEKAKSQGEKTVGMQALLDAVRSTGAKNVVVIGGLEYAYDLSGIITGYAVNDKGGNGIMYASNIYPWKSNWQGKMLDIAKHHPILLGEVGADFKKQPWESQANFVPPETWLPDMLGLIQKYRLNWTGWCFHTSAGPAMLADWRYTPTTYWGAYAKRALAGEQFELKRLR